MTIYISIFLGFLLMSFSFLFLYKLRSKIGLAPLFILLGAVQYFQSNLGQIFSIKILDDTILYPVSTILFSGLLFAILLIYIKEGLANARGVIIGVVVSNVVMSLMLKIANAYQFTGNQLGDVITSNGLISTSIKHLLISTALLIIELLMLVVIYQFLIKKIKKVPFLFSVFIALTIVLVFDAVIYNLISFDNSAVLESSLMIEIVSKSIIALVYTSILYFYLKYFDDEKSHLKDSTNLKRSIFSRIENNKTKGAAHINEKGVKQNLTFDVESTLNNVTDGLISLDSDWYYTYINKKAADLLGKTPEELIGKHIWTVFPEGKGLSFYQIYHKAVETQETIYFEDYYKPLDQWFENRVYPSKDGLTIYFRDITEKKQIDSSNQMLGSLINTSDEFIGLASLEGKPFYLNSNGRALVGLDDDENLPDSITNFFPDYYKKVIQDEQVPSILSDEKWSGEAHLQNFKTNKLIPIEMSGFLIRDEVSNNPIALGIVATNISKRKEAENEILDAQQKMRAAIRIGKIGHWSWDITTDEIYWSDFMYEIYDVNRDTKIEINTVLNKVHPDDKSSYNEFSTHRINNKSSKPFEYRILDKDKTLKYVRVQMEVIENASGVPIKFHGTVRDITEQKQAEEDLINNELLFRELTSTVPAGIFKMALDGTCNYVNKQWIEYAAMSFEDAMGFGWTNAIHPEDRDRVLKEWMQVVPTGDDFNENFRFRNADGKVLFISVKAVGNYNSNNELYGYIGICLDVTQAKEDKEKLINSERLFKRMTSEAPSGIFQTEIDGSCSYVNEKWMQYAGLTYEESMGYGWAEAIHPDDRERISVEWQDYIASGRLELETEFRFLHKNQKVVSVSVKTVGIFDADYNLNGYTGMAIDITERKKAEEELINSELLFRGVTANAPVGIFKTDKEGACNFVNEEWLKYSGLTFKESMGFGWAKAIHDDDYDRVLIEWEKFVMSKTKFNVDFRFVTKENVVTWMSVRAVGLYDASKELYGYIGMNLDITERKKAEDQLIESEKYLENILNNIGDPVFVKDDQSRMILVNDALCSIFNTTKENIIGKTLAENVPSEERDRFLSNDRHVLNTGIENVNEETVNLNSIETRSISTKKTRFIDANGNKFIIGVIRDVTERKKEDQKIAEMQRKIESAIRIGKIGYWSWDMVTDKIFWSDLMYELYDVDRDTELKYNTVADAIHPEDRDFHKTITEDKIKSKSSEPYEYRILLKNGNIRYVLVQTEVVDDDLGNSIKFQGTVIDITERKKVEIKLINNEKLFKRLISKAPVAIFQADKNGSCNYVNQEWMNYTGQSFDDAMGFGWTNAIHPEDKEMSIREWEKSVSTGKGFNLVFRHIHEDGSVSWLSNKAIRTYDENNNFNGYIGITLDITDSKNAEELVVKNKQYLNNIINNIGDPIFVKDDLSRLILVNDAFCSIFGMPREAILGKTLTDKISSIESKTVLDMDIKVIETGEEIVTEESVSINNKEARTFSIKKTRFVNYNDNRQIIGVLRDITESKKVDEQIRRSHQRLTTHINNSPLAIIEWDKDFKITNWSIQAYNIFGWEEADVIGKHFEELGLVYEQDKGITSIIYKELISGDVKINRCINRNNTKENNTIYCEWYNSVLFSPDGEVESFLSMVQDVTERIEIEKSITESEEKFSKVFHSSLIGYSIVNTDQVRVDVNKTMAKMLESTREHLIGKTMEEAKVDVLDDFYFDQKNRLFEKLMKNGFLHNEQIDRTLVSGKRISLLCSVEAIEIAGETHALFAVIDNTENKITELELESYRNNLEELVELRTEEVHSKNLELERMNKLFVGRELRMRELKNMIKELNNKNE